MFLKENEIDNLSGVVSSKDEDISSLNDQINSLNELMLSREKKIKSIRDILTLKASELRAAENEIKITQNKFNILESKYDDNQKILEGAKKELLAYDAKFENQKIIENSYKELIEITQKELSVANNELVDINNELESTNNELESTKNELSEYITKFKTQEIIERSYKELIEINKKELENTKKYFSGRISHLEDQLKSEFLIQSRKIDFYEYCLNFYEEKTYNNEVEINYLKNSNKLSKKILEPFAYLLIFSKSNPRELGRNIRLYKALKNSNFFDIGYYLNKYSDIPESKWCKYFSPELHYVCKGFNENRKINKKDFHSKNKNELLKYIKNN